MIWMLWTTVVTTNHRDAVEDLLGQLTSSMDTLISDSLSDALELVKTAHSTWKFTGTPSSTSRFSSCWVSGSEDSNLEAISVWATGLMQSYFTGSRLTNLRYATPAGLEQSHNGTASGPRVLKRDFYGTGTKQTSCLVTYLGDGLTKLDEGYEDCHYDPRYTDWFVTGREIRGSGANKTEVSITTVVEPD